MMKVALRLFALLLVGGCSCFAQVLSPKWEELTSADFAKAIEQANHVCLLPMGSIEKFGPTGPSGTNLLLVRLVAIQAAKREFAVVFPEYFVAGTADASSFPGTIYYSTHTQMEMLDETTHEMARNGCKKILLVNGHSGNILFISLFLSNFANTQHDYSVYYIYGDAVPVSAADWAKLPPAMQPSKNGADGHGGEERIAALLAFYPGLVHLDRAHDEPITPGHGTEVGGPPSPSPPMQGFMAKLPSGYTGDPSGATAARGNALMDFFVDRLAKTIAAVKADTTTTELQKKFLQQVEAPLAPR